MKSLLTHAGALIERRRQRWSSIAALFALLAFGTPALSQNVPLLSNDYTLANNRKAWLESYVECGSVSCSIAYRIRTDPVDRYVQVVWKDTRGRTLVAGDNADLSNWWNPSPNKFTGYIEAIEWSRGALVGRGNPLQATGTADFSGTGAGVPPCGLVYVCNDADYYYWPSMMSPTSGSASTPGPAERLAAAAGTTHIGTLVGTLANVGVDPAQPEDIGDRRVTFLEFSSAVDFENGEYLYRYSATNHTDLTVPIAWDGAGLSGELLPFSTLERSLSSSLMPTILDSAPAWTLTTNSAFPLVKQGAYGLEVYAPVPEPRLSMLLVAGLALLALRRRQRARHHA